MEPRAKCKRCGHWIWTEESLQSGYGPICTSIIIYEKVVNRLCVGSNWYKALAC